MRTLTLWEAYLKVRQWQINQYLSNYYTGSLN